MPGRVKKVRSSIARARLLRTMFDKAGIGVAFRDIVDGQFLYANPAFCEIVGYTRDELRSMRPADFTHVDDQAASRDSYERLVRGETTKRVAEKRYVRKDRNLVWVRLRTAIVKVRSIPVSLTVVEDISEQKLAEMRLASSESRLRKSNEAKDVFLASLAHELRNPLAAIRSSVEVIKRLQLDDHRLEAVSGILERQSGQLSRLVEDLFDTSRVTTGKVALDLRRLELREVLDRAVDAIAPLMRSRSQALLVDVPAEAIFVRADLVRLTQVFSNLLDNASKYTGNGGRIAVIARVKAGEVRVVVEDTGAGIPEDHLPHVFELFAQGMNPGASSRGLGIGLTIVKRLVELHHGRITVSSVVGKGSAFHVTLPVDPASPSDEAREASDTNESPPEWSAIRPMRILIVDDNEEAAASLALCLQMSGHAVRTAHSATDALRVARRFKPEISLLDIELPDMDGYELGKQLKSTAGTSHTLLVAVTGNADVRTAASARSAGFAHHLLKPVTTAQLHTVFQSVARN